MIRDLENIVVHSTWAELRLAIGSAVSYYQDKEDPQVIWIKGVNATVYTPHTTAAAYATAQLTDGIPGGGGSGTQGVQGIQGLQGATGQKGVQGVAGNSGSQGTAGIQGKTGLQGSNGAQGIKGDTGLQGSKGIDGVQGSAGLQGAKGDTGLQGVMGEKGVQGSIGNQGLQGLQGPAGGGDGGSGVQGVQGLQGMTGSQGPTGLQGAQGPVGPEDPTVLKYDPVHGLVLPKTASISAVQDEDTGSAGTLVCQRNYGSGDVTELGNSRNKLTLNATERPQIDLAGGSKEKMAYESDLIKYGMFYPGVKVDTQKLFALTKSSTEDEIKAALQLETSSGSYTLPTDSILNDCIGKGYQLLSNWMPVNVAWNGAAWVFYLIGQVYMNQPNVVATVSIKITDGVYSVFQAVKLTQLATFDDIKLIPNVIRFPLRTLQDKVYTQEEILEWFGVEEVPDLKQLIVSGGIYYLQYGISLSGNPMYYKMPVEYVAFESATQIKLAFTGLNTHNDAPAKYEILMNLDGTILEDNCNIQITMTELVTSTEFQNKISELEARITALEGTN